MAIDLLPDSRLKRPVGAKPGPGGYWVPVFCAMCGAPYGYVPEENCSFACWLCNDCSNQHGETFSGMLMPEERFWELVKQEQLEKYRRLLTPEELQQVLAADATPLAHLIREGV